MTDNKMIAEFMGLQWIGGGHVADEYRNNVVLDEYGWAIESEYENNWNWLMPVVEKVFELSKDNFSIGSKVVNHGQLQFNSDSTIEAVYKAVVHFIKWYNNSLN